MRLLDNGSSTSNASAWPSCRAHRTTIARRVVARHDRIGGHFPRPRWICPNPTDRPATITQDREGAAPVVYTALFTVCAVYDGRVEHRGMSPIDAPPLLQVIRGLIGGDREPSPLPRRSSLCPSWRASRELRSPTCCWWPRSPRSPTISRAKPASGVVQQSPRIVVRRQHAVVRKLGDLYGHRRVFIWGWTAATVLAFATRLSPNVASLIVLRTASQLAGASTSPPPSGFWRAIVRPQIDRVPSARWSPSCPLRRSSRSWSAGAGGLDGMAADVRRAGSHCRSRGSGRGATASRNAARPDVRFDIAVRWR